MPAAFLPVLFRYVAAAHRDTIQQYISNAYILHYNEIFGKMVANVFFTYSKIWIQEIIILSCIQKHMLFCNFLHTNQR